MDPHAEFETELNRNLGEQQVLSEILNKSYATFLSI